MMGVDYIVVEGEPVQMDGVVSGTNYDTRLQNLDQLFRKHTRDSWMMQIKDVLTGYFKMKVAGSAR